MPQIRPVSDLRNNFAEISKIVHESREPVFLTKNGYGDMVVMSIEQYESIQLENEIFIKLKEAELEAKNSDVRYSHSEIFDKIKSQLNNGKDI
ncbi:type II toxin-antitoxin system Phd/YefM family antitoxin [Paenibacillus sp. Soil787]|uniref:type II toxin-antitoxin system Phd/YefM family antitoxin n=1 Tax=Paenibacillus sp. Soil787 TaxID=1736411 RepID=UPI0006FC11CE|nr:type II toxin-antitoxin system Phd/YefM family antitoxin [Paenibacillus sp. Soil787]KRF39839.1 prevent-host-death protein [Paenibacillus sp. Soil787]